MEKPAAVALLQWYQEAGVDEALEMQPVNRFEPAGVAVHEAKAKPSPVAVPLPTMYRTEPDSTMPHAPVIRPVSSPAAAIAEARLAADQAKTLDQLRAAVLAFDGCALKATATQTVFADGNPYAELMVIGEAPGAEEDKLGIPFCGASGKLLEQMFAAIGYTRAKDFYITNTLFWRPPGNRQPSQEELAICEPFVEKHIALIAPKLLVLVGGTAVKSILRSGTGITKMRGQDFRYTNKYLNGKEIPVRITFHPSYLMRQPAQKKAAWEDMQVIRHLHAEKRA